MDTSHLLASAVYSIKEDKFKKISGKGEEIENMREKYDKILRHCKN